MLRERDAVPAAFHLGRDTLHVCGPIKWKMTVRTPGFIHFVVVSCSSRY